MRNASLLLGAAAILIGCGGGAPPPAAATAATLSEPGSQRVAEPTIAGEIQGLSKDEIRGYKEGRAMRFGRAAEKNHNPSPYFLLKYRSELGLFDEQTVPAKAILDRERAIASRLGKDLLENQGKLEQLLNNPAGSRDDEVAALVREIARIQGEIRLVHLQSDVAAKKLLNSEQQVQYDAIRSYDPDEDGRDAMTDDGVCATRP
jgi:hypothetical protein